MRRRDAGFTLIEMLVTVVVLGLLAASLLQGSRLGIAAWDGADRRQRDLMEAEAAERVLRDVIARMVPLAQNAPPLLGTPGTMAFRATATGETTIAIGLGLDAAKRLVLRELAAGRGGVRETILLESVERLAFAYWQGGVWQTEWRRDGVPRLVRVQYQLGGRLRRQWPALVIGIVADAGER
ncbi:MAG: prepilin-type N-terminal cleavage/methylation domain-containing protein [Alphaproteobacteria bacterium]|nr:prepilin-type N-terminal cleavage/methylation domain-containing protein [Alphaproteobacteria bacterium]